MTAEDVRRFRGRLRLDPFDFLRYAGVCIADVSALLPMPPHPNTQAGTAVRPGTITRSEILQQPDLWPTTLEIVRKSGFISEKPNQPVIITGAGTSAYAAQTIAAAWPNAQGVPTTDLLIQTGTEIGMMYPGFPASGLLISLGRSGDSPESVAVVQRIKKVCPGVAHLAITCNSEGRLAKTPGVRPIVLDARTNDRGLAMTSSFSNLVLAGLCLRHGRELEQTLPAVCAKVREHLGDLEAQAERLASEQPERVVVLGSGALRALASEASLKILEMTAGRTATLAETFLGLRHGPMSFLTEQTLVLCFLSSSPHRRQYEEDLVRELRQKRLGRIVGIAPEGTHRDLLDEAVEANAGSLPDDLRTPFEIPFAQLLAYHLSIRQGLDPDNPSPMGAITRVVKTFTIYEEELDV